MTVAFRVRAIRVDHPGGSEVLRLVEVPEPQPGPGEVLIAVAASGVGFVDTLFRRGAFDFPAPFVPGIEVSGHVVRIGPDIDPALRLREGLPVAAFLNDFARGSAAAGYAEFAVARADLVVPLPDGIEPVRAAAVMMNGATAWWALHNVAQVQPGATVLALGASGGVGECVVRLGAHAGATVIAAVGNVHASRAHLLTAGAAAVVARTSLDQVRTYASDGVDVIVDPVGGPARVESLSLLRPLGTMVIVGNASGGDLPLSGDELWLGSKAVVGISIGGVAHLVADRLRTAAQRAIATLATSDGVTAQSVEPERIGEVHDALESGSAPSKTIIRWR